MTYGNVADWQAYASDRGNSAPNNGQQADLEASLLRASDYIRTRYVIRYNLSDSNPNVIEATYIAASYDLDNPGFWQTTFTPSQAKVLTQAGDIKWTVPDGLMSGVDGQLPISPAIEALLVPRSGSGAVLMVI